MAGMATHLAYGSAWGALFGLIQGTWRRPPVLLGALYGLIVYAVFFFDPDGLKLEIVHVPGLTAA